MTDQEIDNYFDIDAINATINDPRKPREERIAALRKKLDWVWAKICARRNAEIDAYYAAHPSAPLW
jgi:hypothetical protein